MFSAGSRRGLQHWPRLRLGQAPGAHWTKAISRVDERLPSATRERLELAQRMGATLTFDPRERDLGDVQRELGMTEGFDVGLEMSGNGDALRSMVSNMAHGGRIAVLGIPTAEITLDLNPIIFNMLTLKGIYGRCLLYTSPSPRDLSTSRMPSSA